MKKYKLLVFDWEGTLAQQNTMFTKSAEVLRQLNSAGYMLAIATSKYRSSLQRCLREYELEKLFTIISCGDDKFVKPDARVLADILSELDLDTSEAVMIGDSQVDMVMAHDAGVDAVLINNYGERNKKLLSYNPVAYIAGIAELPQLFVFDS